MDDFLNYHSNDLVESVTIESLAWKLLLDEDVKDYVNVLLPFVTNDEPIEESNNNLTFSNAKYYEYVDQFQILIAIYLEMVFGLLKINHVATYLNENGEMTENADIEKTFKPDMSRFKIDDMLVFFRERLKKIRILLFVHEIVDTKEPNNASESDDDSDVKHISCSDYYCKILLRDSPEGKKFFWQNRDKLDPDKPYMFALRYDNEKKQRLLSDFYAICELPNMKVKISFSPINVIINDSHMIE
jgi:hypothetical protein